MSAGLYEKRLCKYCKEPFIPRYAHEQVHRECWNLWRRRYNRLYQKRVRKAEFRIMQEPSYES